MLPDIIENYIAKSPICVMARGVLENLFAPARLDELFRRTARTQ